MKIFKLTTLLLTLMVSQFLNAQGWEKTYDGGLDENVRAADRTPDGGIIMAGAQSNDTTDLSVPFIYKTDVDGNLQWEFYKTEAESDFVAVYEVVALNDGNILLSFETDSNLPLNDGVVIQKLDPAGNIIWTTTFAEDTLGWVKSIKAADSGDIFVAGGFVNPNTTNQQATAVVKLNADGDFQWTQSFVDPDDLDLPHWVGGLALCSDGGVVVFGYYGFFNGNQSAFSRKWTVMVIFFGHINMIKQATSLPSTELKCPVVNS